MRELSLNFGKRLVFHLKGTIMNWETPSFEEIDMSAEIGSYQGEDDNGL
ncbi:MAG TPA: pyrroloquinoline quinone precursor peptide PqqA [Polyangiaceae bacterium]|nr:pyrroloquinoline quinone precursor peptide PqqA [Polyangiaceae bacterium]